MIVITYECSKSHSWLCKCMFTTRDTNKGYMSNWMYLGCKHSIKTLPRICIRVKAHIFESIRLHECICLKTS